MSNILLFDSYDSFTYNLKDYLEQCGAQVIVVKNDSHSIDELKAIDFDGIVLSPGPQTPEKSGNLMEVIDTFITTKPILGVCLGHQALGVYFGVPLAHLEVPMHGKVSILNGSTHSLFNGLPPSFEVCRYHSLVLPDFKNEQLEVIAVSDDNKVMAISHKQLPVWGVQFHPEAILTQYGLQMIANWHSMVKLLN
ncbi:MAG: anthranilate synthase/aminodeoxychorismate synthase-like glutamine amidotransferase [Bacteroidia bacterium]|jgi:anthranilate synthase/aminodeoxychorismate synthase-like glutamine amidotransferase